LEEILFLKETSRNLHFDFHRGGEKEKNLTGLSSRGTEKRKIFIKGPAPREESSKSITREKGCINERPKTWKGTYATLPGRHLGRAAF